jgi:hypothetical protein
VAPDPAYRSNADFHLFSYGFRADVIGFRSIMHLTLAGVSFKTLFVFPLPIPPKGMGVYNAKLLGLCKPS